MAEKVFKKQICLKEHIYKEEYNEISKLEKICTIKDNVNLKLEVDYKLNVCKDSNIQSKNINEFLYYVDDVLVSYLGISSFRANICELNGMSHPDWKRKGLFKKLFELAIEECKTRNFNKILLLTDSKSESGEKFIKAVRGVYDFSEYRMSLCDGKILKSSNVISLRKSEKLDKKEIGRQNAIFFNDIEESILEEEEIPNEFTYMIEINKEIIGKIRIGYEENSAFISGFGILPNFRRRGYGNAALKEALALINERNIKSIELDVECKNDTALNLYTACGFKEKSIMNYYKYNIKNM